VRPCTAWRPLYDHRRARRSGRSAFNTSYHLLPGCLAPRSPAAASRARAAAAKAWGPPRPDPAAAAGMCRAHGIAHQRVTEPGALRGALAAAWGLNRHSVVEVATARRANVAHHRTVQAAVGAAVLRALRLATAPGAGDAADVCLGLIVRLCCTGMHGHPHRHAEHAAAVEGVPGQVQSLLHDQGLLGTMRAPWLALHLDYACERHCGYLQPRAASPPALLRFAVTPRQCVTCARAAQACTSCRWRCRCCASAVRACSATRCRWRPPRPRAARRTPRTVHLAPPRLRASAKACCCG